MARWKVEVLGGIRARSTDGRLVEEFRTSRCALLMAFFAVSPRIRYSREVVAELLWPEAPPELQKSRLRNELANLRRAFGGEEVIQRVGNNFLILAPDVTSDAAAFEKAYAAATHQPDPTLRTWLLREAVSLYAGDFLPGFYDDWTLDQRERLRGHLRKTLVTLTDLLWDLNDFPQAQYWRTRLQALFPEDADSCGRITGVSVPVAQSGQGEPGFQASRRPSRAVGGGGYPPGSLVVASFDGDVLYVLDPSGGRIGEVHSHLFSEPWGVAQDRNGHVYVANRTTGTICRLSPDLSECAPFASLPIGSDPFGLAVDRDGCLLAAAGRAGRIHRFSPAGDDLGIFAERGVYHPRAIAILPNGDLLVTSAFRSVVCRYGADGAFIGLFAHDDLALPHGLAVDADGHVYVSNVGVGTVHRFSPDGMNLGVFATPGACSPACLTFDAAGNLFVSCAATSVVRCFLPDGSERGVFADGLPNPSGLLILP